MGTSGPEAWKAHVEPSTIVIDEPGDRGTRTIGGNRVVNGEGIDDTKGALEAGIGSAVGPQPRACWRQASTEAGSVGWGLGAWGPRRGCGA